MWFILIFLPLPMLLVIYQLFRAIKTNSEQVMMFVFILLFIVVITVPIFWLFVKMKLIVEIREDGVWYKFPPLLYKWKSITKIDIEKFEVRRYKPVLEYGGWGIKGRFKSKAYNVSGNIGLQLYLKSGRKVLFDTQRSEAIKSAMDKMMNATQKVL